MKQTKRNRKQQQILRELESNPLIERACKKVGIARSTFYKWAEASPQFRTEADIAQDKGRAKFSDYVESKLMENIGQNQHSAITYWLGHNTTRYRTYPHRAYAEELDRLKRIEHTIDEISDLLLNNPEGHDALLKIARQAKEDLEKGTNNRFNTV